MELRDSTGTHLIDTAKVSVDSLRAAADGPRSGLLPRRLPCDAAQHTGSHVKRSDKHNPFSNNAIYWMTSGGGTDAYPRGINDVYPSWTPGLWFPHVCERWRRPGAAAESAMVSLSTIRSSAGREFRVDYPKVTLTSVALNLHAGSATTGKTVRRHSK